MVAGSGISVWVPGHSKKGVRPKRSILRSWDVDFQKIRPAFGSINGVLGKSRGEHPSTVVSPWGLNRDSKEYAGATNAAAGFVESSVVDAGVDANKVTQKENVGGGFLLPHRGVTIAGAVPPKKEVFGTSKDIYAGSAGAKCAVEVVVFDPGNLDVNDGSSGAGGNPNGATPTISYIRSDYSEQRPPIFPPLRSVSGTQLSGMGEFWKDNVPMAVHADNSNLMSFTRGSVSRSLVLIGSASAMEYAWREGVQTEYGATVSISDDALSYGSMGSVCSIPASSEICIPGKVSPVHVGFVPVVVAVFTMGPGVPIFHPASVMSSAPVMYFRELIIAFDQLPDRCCWCLPETVVYVDSSGDEGPDFCSDYCQPADKPYTGQSSSEKGDPRACFRPSDQRNIVNMVWIAMFGYRRHCFPLWFLV